jgi:TDG/mug DNA glycosylase family protein
MPRHPSDVLPDLLRPGLRLVFCGTGAGPVSAKLGLYYAAPGNRFWPTLHRVGLTPTLFAPSQYPDLLPLGIGLTDVAKLAWGLDSDLPADELGPLARARLLEKIERLAPRVLAFTSKRAARAALGRVTSYGAQTPLLGQTLPWVLPSTSGLARGSWDEAPWQELGERVRALS